MGYQALYRKWRPQTFTELVGQTPIVTALCNQVKEGRLAHAYLFTGSRGTGKTSAAKILARAVNCQNPQDGNPCNECAVCRGLLNETILDVMEIDAASNNGVENIRRIRDEVLYPPTAGRYKVYIIDEVHMLSAGAFNAFLKTLEEPPEHVIFILATTDPHKVLPTILSRCQRFDFGRIGLSDLVSRLQFVCEQEGITAAPQALNQIARSADGGMRDALSLLDGCLAVGGKDLTAEVVRQVLGTVGEEFLVRLTDALMNGQTADALNMTAVEYARGADLFLLYEGLLRHACDLLLFAAGAEPDELTALDEDLCRTLKVQAQKYPQERLVRMVGLISQTLGEARLSKSAKVLFNAMLVRLSRPEMTPDLAAVLDRIARLEQGRPIAPAVPAPTPEPIKEAEPVPVVEPAVVPTPEPEAAPVEDISNDWADVLHDVKERVGSGPMLSFLKNAEAQVHNDGLYLVMDSENECEMMRMMSAQLDKVAQSVAHVTGKQMRIRVVSRTQFHEEIAVDEGSIDTLLGRLSDSSFSDIVTIESEE